MSLDPVVLDDPHVPAHNEERDAINQLQLDVANRVILPNSPPLGTLMRWDGDKWAPTSMRLFEGNGSPEGVVSAPPGSRFVDSTAAGGVAEWFKASGVGNTGWQPLNSGLPWANIALNSGWTHESGNPAQVSVLNGAAYYRGVATRTSGSSVTMGTIPDGYRPTKTLYSMARMAGQMLTLGITSGGTVTVSSGYDNGDPVYVGSITGIPYRTS